MISAKKNMTIGTITILTLAGFTIIHDPQTVPQPQYPTAKVSIGQWKGEYCEYYDNEAFVIFNSDIYDTTAIRKLLEPKNMTIKRYWE